MCTDPGCRNPRCVELRHFWATYSDALALVVESTLVVESNTKKESPMKAVLNIGPAPAILKTAQNVDPGIVFVTKSGQAVLRTMHGLVPLEGMGAFATFGLETYFGSHTRARDIEVSRVVGPLEISRA